MMNIREVSYNDVKSYANRKTLEKALVKYFGESLTSQRYIVVTNDAGRLVPVFLGQQAIQAGIHFHFCVAG